MNNLLGLARVSALGVIALFASVVVVPAYGANDDLPPMELQRFGEHVYVVQGQAGQASSANAGFISNAGAVATGEGLVVFDTLGTPALGAKFRELIEEASGEKVKLVVV